MAVKAVLRNLDTSPKKVRRVLGLIRGKPVREAMGILHAIPSPVAEAVLKVVKSAVANAENNNSMAADDLKVVEAVADDGRKLKRFRPQSRGRMSPILKRSCHVTIAVDEEEAKGGT